MLRAARALPCSAILSRNGPSDMDTPGGRVLDAQNIKLLNNKLKMYACFIREMAKRLPNYPKHKTCAACPGTKRGKGDQIHDARIDKQRCESKLEI
eukprot:2977970-Pleurochrysis_carterae.AAC.1